MRVIYIMPGEMIAVAEAMHLKTILGSCIAVALFDPEMGVGGLNHFLLPYANPDTHAADYGRYGNTSIPLLIRRVLKLGARADHLQARIVGGGAVVKDLVGEFRVGDANIDLARTLLEAARIHIVEEDIGGSDGRHLTFDTERFTVTVREIKHGRKNYG